MPWPPTLLPLATELPEAPASLQEAQQSVDNATSFVEQNWATWLSIGLRILLIVVIAAVIRSVVRKALTKLRRAMETAFPTEALSVSVADI